VVSVARRPGFLTPPMTHRSSLGVQFSSFVIALVSSTASAQAVRAGDGVQGSVRFIENLGQWPADVQFAADFGGVMARAECGGLGFHSVSASGEGHYVRLVFPGAGPIPQPRGVNALPGVHHYYLGNDPSRWQRNARAFARVEYAGVYPGVDLVLYANQGRPKYDLILAPGVEPSTVRARWLGADEVQTSTGGVGLLLGSAALQEMPVVAWQPRGKASRRPVSCSWEDLGNGELVLRATDLDPSLPLVVDPELVWSTYLGSSVGGSASDWSIRPAVDSQGDVHVVGATRGLDFPVTPGAFHIALGSVPEWCTLTKLRSQDGQAVFSSVFGGSTYNRGNDVSADPWGRSVVVGNTNSHDFPLTAGSYDPDFTGEVGGFVLRFSPYGDQLEFGTILEPVSGLARAQACASKPNGSTVVAGHFDGPQFPSTMPPLGTLGTGPSPAGAYVLELNASGTGVTWARQIGSIATVMDFAVAPDGTLTLAGYTHSRQFPTTPGVFQPTMSGFTNMNAFVSRLSPDAQDLIWSTFLGGSQPNEEDIVLGVGLDAFGGVALGIQTNSASFPTTPGTLRPEPPPADQGTAWAAGVLCRLSSDASRLIYSTFTTTSSSVGGFTYPRVDASGVVTIIGAAGSMFPGTPGAYDEVYGPGQQFQIARLDPYGRRFLHLTHVGGTGQNYVYEIAESPAGRVTVVGEVLAPGGLPTTPGSFQPDFAGGFSDAFVTTMYLDVAGVTEIGPGTPACHGAIRAAALRKPSPGAADFGLYCSGAPQNARGALLVGRPRSSPVVFGGADIHVDRSAGWRMLRVHTDEFGYVESSLPIPALIPGSTYAVQYVFQNQEECQGTGRLSSSPGLRLVIQQP